MDLFSMSCDVVCGVDQDVIHIDGQPVFAQFFCEYGVHHSLECSGGIRESEEHDSRFEQALIGDEGCLPFVSFFDAYVIVSPAYVEFGE